MSDNAIAADGAAAPRSLREDLEATWDQMAADAKAEEDSAGLASDRGFDDDTPEGDRGSDPAAEADPEPSADNGYLPLDHWPAEWRTRFEELSDDAKPYVLDLHKSLEQAHSERSQMVAEREKELAALEAIDTVLAPHREMMEAYGISQEDALSRLLEAHAWLEQDPQAGLAAIAQSYGLDPHTAAAPAPGAYAPQSPDMVQAGPDMTQQTALLEALDQHAAEQHELRVIAAMEAQLAARARATDEAGRPRFPYFDAVRPRLAALMRAGTAGSFEDAYDQAVWADPILREEALKARDARMAEKRESTRKAEVSKARKAGRSAIRGSEPGLSTLPPARSHREELERVWDQLVSE